MAPFSPVELVLYVAAAFVIIYNVCIPGGPKC